MGVTLTTGSHRRHTQPRRTVRRRRCAATIAAALAVSVLAACGSSNNSAETTNSSSTSSAVADSSTASSAAPDTSSSPLSSAPDTSSSTASSSAPDSGSAGSRAVVTSMTTTIAGAEIKTDPALAAAVPAAIRAKGVIKDISYNNAPPDTFVLDGKLVGWEIDLGQAVAVVLGLKWEATPSGAFDSFIPGLQNGRYDVSFTSFIQTPERLKQIDIVTYFNVGTGFAVKKGSVVKIAKETDVCGHGVAVLAGSAFIQQIDSIKCAEAGLEPVKVQSFPSDAAAELAVSSGRSEVYSSSSNQLEYLLKQTKGAFEIQPLNFMPTPEGAGVTKGSGMAKSIGDAMDNLIKSGAYKEIMAKWEITNGLVDKATVYADGGS